VPKLVLFIQRLCTTSPNRLLLPRLVSLEYSSTGLIFKDEEILLIIVHIEVALAAYYKVYC